uniref:Uncharacterized protein n=1 Tax=Anguilla anguilla TaxID=7936 RepID=A0A0E9V6X2_ANGAN
MWKCCSWVSGYLIEGGTYPQPEPQAQLHHLFIIIVLQRISCPHTLLS